MKCITVCQPYPFLIGLPITDPRHKRVENRTWPTRYRGDLAIHAGKSTAWMDSFPLDPADDSRLVFGCVTAIVRVIACLDLDEIAALGPGPLAWLKDHQHVSGPSCWVFDRVRLLRYPVSARGSLGLWDWTPPAALDLIQVDREGASG